MFNKKLFGRLYVRAYASKHARKRMEKLYDLKEVLKTAWPGAIQKLHEAILHVLPSIKDETLAQQVEAFPFKLYFQVNSRTGHITILSDDEFLERALFFGTRQLPAVKPLQLLVSYLKKSVNLSQIVFTARDFTHETRKTSESHSQSDSRRSQGDGEGSGNGQ